MAFYFESDIGHVCKITAEELSAEINMFTAGSVDKFCDKVFAVQGEVVDYRYITTMNVDSPMGYIHRLYEGNNDVVMNTLDPEEVYRRAVLIMMPYVNDRPAILTQSTQGCYLVTDITNYGDKIVYNKTLGCCQYSTFVDGIVKSTNAEITTQYMIVPYYEFTRGGVSFYYLKERLDGGHVHDHIAYLEQRAFRVGGYIGNTDVITDFTKTTYLFKVNTLEGGTKPTDTESGTEYEYNGRTLKTQWDYSDPNFHIIVGDVNYDELFDIASFGLYFIADDVKYKPIISGGVVTGYTDNLSTPSEIDDYTSLDHYVPTPSDRKSHTEDKIDDMTLGYTSFANSFTRYYLLNNTQLASLSTAISTSQTQGLINNVVSLKSFAVNPNSFIGLKNTESIVIGSETMSVSGDKIQSLVYDSAIGTTTVGGFYGTSSKPHFLDFAPYTRLELYIPYCGIVELPSHCMYRDITVYLVGDVTDGSCTGVVKCDGQIVAQKAGVIGSGVAISVTENSMRDNAIISGIINTAGGTIATCLSGASGNVGGAMSGALSVASSVTNTINSMNQNYTRVTGVSTGKVLNALPDSCYLIRMRPDKINTDYYAKTYGVPCEKTLTLTSGDGFTVVDNLNTDSITGITAQEREELKSFYSRGVIL